MGFNVMKVQCLFLLLLLRTRAVKDEAPINDDEVLFIRDSELGLFNSKAKTSKTILAQDNMLDVDHDYETKTIFYLAVDNHYYSNLYSMNMITREKKMILSKPYLDSFVVDWISKNIYLHYRHAKYYAIEVCDFEGRYVHMLYYGEEARNIKGIAVAPKYGFLFLTYASEEARIEQANLDGSSRNILVKENLIMPKLISVDEKNELVYWYDIIQETIEVVSMNGKNRKTLYRTSDFGIVDSITVQEYRLYFSTTRSMFSCDMTKNISICRKELDGSVDVVRRYGSTSQSFSNSACHANNANCSHLCLGIRDSYVCACPTGYKLLEDGKTCSDVITEKIFLATRSNLQIISLDTDMKVGIRLPIENIYHGNSIDFDIENEMVYYTEETTFEYGVIKRVKLDGSAVQEVVEPGFAIPDVIAVDWIARNIYWSCRKQNKIYVTRTDGSSTYVIADKSLGKPRGIVVDPETGRLYFSDWGEKPKIEMADLDGENRVVLVDKDLGWPNHMALDHTRQHLYWLDTKLRRMEFYDLVKKTRHQIEKKFNTPHMYGITVLGNYVYWTDWITRSVYRLNIVTRTSEKIIHHAPDLMGLTAVNISREYGENPCKHHNNGCSHFCFYKPNGSAFCSCGNGHVLDGDGKSCHPANGYLLFSARTFIQALSFHSTIASESVLVVGNEITFIETHSRSDAVIWVETAENGQGSVAIKKAYFNDSKQVHIIQSGFYGDIGGIAIDDATGNLYWLYCSRSYARIEVSRLNGAYRRTLINTVGNKMVLLALDPYKRKLYWFEFNDGNTTLRQSNLDGSNIVNLYNITGEPGGLTVDKNTSRIYWVSDHSIQSVDHYGGKYRKHFILSGKSSGLAMFRDKLYYFQIETVNSVSQAVVSIDKNNNVSNVLYHNNKGSQVWKSVDIAVLHSDIVEDTNDCSVLNGGCSHLCIPTSNGEGSCMCEMHYTLDPRNGKYCLEPETFIFLSEPTLIYRFLLDRSVPEIPLFYQSKIDIDQIDYNMHTNTLFWLNQNEIKYFSVGEKKILNLGVGAMPYSFVIDFYTNYLYWTDIRTDSINFININKQTTKGMVFRQKGCRPRKLAIFPERGLLFFVDESNSSSKHDYLYSVSLDGNSLREIKKFDQEKKKLSHSIYHTLKPYDLSIHYERERIFWVRSSESVIESANIGGDNFKTEIKFQQQFQPLSVSTYGKYMYWVDHDNNNRYDRLKMKPLQSNKISVFPGRYERSRDLLIVDSKRLKIKHPCKFNNGGCSHICYADKGDYVAKCGCPLGFTKKGKRKNYCEVVKKDKCMDICNDDCRGSQVNCEDIKTCTSRYSSCVCRKDEFHCLENRCISKERVCDGAKDCQKGEDENLKACKAEGNYSTRYSTNTPKVVRYSIDDYSKYTAGIISGVILTILVIACAVYVICRTQCKKLCNLPKRENVMQDESIYEMCRQGRKRAEEGSDVPTESIFLPTLSVISANQRKGLPNNNLIGRSDFQVDHFDSRYITGSSTNVTDSIMMPLNPPPSVCLTDIGIKSVAHLSDTSHSNFYDKNGEVVAPPATPLYSPSEAESIRTFRTGDSRQPGSTLRPHPCSCRDCQNNKRDILYRENMQKLPVNPSLPSSYISKRPHSNYNKVISKRHDNSNVYSSEETLFGKSISRQISYASGLQGNIDAAPRHESRCLPSIASEETLSRCNSLHSAAEVDTATDSEFYQLYDAPPSTHGTSLTDTRTRDYANCNTPTLDYTVTSPPSSFHDTYDDIKDFSKFQGEDEDEDGETDAYEVNYLMPSDVNNASEGEYEADYLLRNNQSPNYLVDQNIHSNFKR